MSTEAKGGGGGGVDLQPKRVPVSLLNITRPPVQAHLPWGE